MGHVALLLALGRSVQRTGLEVGHLMLPSSPCAGKLAEVLVFPAELSYHIPVFSQLAGTLPWGLVLRRVAFAVRFFAGAFKELQNLALLCDFDRRGTGFDDEVTEDFDLSF